MDGLHLGVLHLTHEVAHQVTVGGNRCDGRLVNLLLRGINTLLLVNGDIVVGKEAIGEINNLPFGHALHTMDTLNLILPLHTIDESINKSRCASIVAFQRAEVFEFLVVDDAGQQVIRELTLFQLLDFTKQELPHFVERLFLLGHSTQDKEGIVSQRLTSTIRLHHLHCLIEIEVQQSCLSV